MRNTFKKAPANKSQAKPAAPAKSKKKPQAKIQGVSKSEMCALQSSLADLGHYKKKIDGIYGKFTHKAVKACVETAETVDQINSGSLRRRVGFRRLFERP